MTLTETRVHVRREPMVYDLGSGASFFADLARAKMQDSAALVRLERHAHEMDVEYRTNPNTTAGTGGEWAPPLWAIERFSTVARHGRVLADLCLNLPLPAGVSSVHTPNMTTGAKDDVQQAQGTAVPKRDQITADAKQGQIVTIAGNVDASLQLLDQTPAPGYDGIVYTDLEQSYNANLETQLLTGLGTGGTLTGCKNWSGINTDIDGSSVSATQATMVPVLVPLIGRAIASVGNNRGLPATTVIMAPRRWSAIASNYDATTGPTTFPGDDADRSDYPATNQGRNEALQWQGIRLYQDGALNTGTAADDVYALRPEDFLLYESTPKFAIDMNPLSGTLEVRLQVRRYVAFVIQQASSVTRVKSIPATTGFAT